ncbi:Zinc phosphodiesterase ELAC protein 2 [Trichinella nativa]|uniref:Zinc phosphodiesterase ELAC protein 2 n=1 Tax=Trichinella nativa TaxID=6335 RepID=A0A0V1L202_9BILA|nr:Zinc phosphodiesterase ELAC protein 2 [Trichinella nativa]
MIYFQQLIFALTKKRCSIWPSSSSVWLNIRLLSTMPPSPESTSKRARLYRTSYTGPATAYFEIIQSGCHGRGKCLILFTTSSVYLFNSPEGTERLFCEHGVKNSRLNHVFYTRASWDNVNGLNGLILSLRKAGCAELHLHGAQAITKIVRGAEQVSDWSGPPLNVIEHCDCNDSHFEDDSIQVQYLPLVGGEECSEEKTDERRPTFAYFCRIKQKSPKLLLEKCVQLNVPVGPLLGRLQAGCDVQLDDGTTVRSEDVLEPAIPCPTFVVVECPRGKEPPKWSAIERLLRQDETLDAVVHLTDAQVYETDFYQRWMVELDGKTCHVVLNEAVAPVRPHSEAIYRFSVQLNRVHSTIFPLLCTHDQATVADTRSPLLLTTGRQSVVAVAAEPWLRFNLRPDPGSVYKCAPSFDRATILEPIDGQPLVVDELRRFQERLSGQIGDQIDQYPAVTFLGTSSASPVKTRNVSALLIHLDDSSTVLCDCGESTYSQAYLRYGADGIGPLLRSVKLIFISHMHGDHFFGLPTFLRHRFRAYQDCQLEYEPVFLVAPQNLLRILTMFESFSGSVQQLCKTILTHRLHPLTEQSQKYLHEAMLSLNVKRLEFVPVAHPMGAHGLVLTTVGNKTVVYSGDTRPCPALVSAGQGADLLIHEATMEDDLAQEAVDKKHSTISEAIAVGRAMGAGFTLLTHFSGRYNKLPLVDERHCSESIGLAFDFMRVSLAENMEVQSGISEMELDPVLNNNNDGNNNSSSSALCSGEAVANLSTNNDNQWREEKWTGSLDVGRTTSKVSKNQLKKMKKRERWLLSRQARRQEQAAKRKQRKVEARLRGEPSSAGGRSKRKLLKLSSMELSNCRQRVAVDMSFDDLMNERDLCKALNQLAQCYAVNRRARNPLQFHVVNFRGISRVNFDNIPGNSNWDVLLSEDDYEQLFGRWNVVYLTSESPNVVHELDESKVYIIGGLVDHNHLKGRCLELAEQRQVAHARLPIDEHVKMNARRVLSINHVFEILLRYTETKSWQVAIETVVPKRKLLQTQQHQLLPNSTAIRTSGEANNGHNTSSDD